MDGRYSLSTAMEGREPGGSAQDSPSAQLQAQTAPTARRSDDAVDANFTRALTTALQSEQMEALLRRLLRQGQLHDAIAPAVTAAFAPSAGLFPHPSLRSSFHFRHASQPSTPSTSEI